MIRHKALHTLSHEHHHGLMLAQLIKANAPKYENLPKTIKGKKSYTLKFYEENLIPHFKKEEEILFPLSKGKTSAVDKLVDDLVDQHNSIASLIKRIKASDSPGNELNELGSILEMHIRKEERELFPKVQEILSENKLKELELLLGKTSASCEI